MDQWTPPLQKNKMSFLVSSVSLISIVDTVMDSSPGSSDQVLGGWEGGGEVGVATSCFY